jgi:quercetin dioxygenase-like cupin family protein
MSKDSNENYPSHPRPDTGRALSGPLLGFDLPTINQRLKHEKAWENGSHNGITLMKSKSMRIVLIAMHKGDSIKMEMDESPASVHVLDGKLEVFTTNESTVLHKEQLLTLNENILKEIKALHESTLLLTMCTAGSYKLNISYSDMQVNSNRA